MRVALNVTEALWEKTTGTGVYVQNLVRGLAEKDEIEELTLLSMKSAQPGGREKDMRGSIRYLGGFQSRTLWSQVRLPLHFLRNKYDLIHLPDHKLPPWTSGRTVVTIHDLACFKFPETFSLMHRNRLQYFTRDAIKRADHLIAVSRSTKDDICEMFGRDPEEVDVVYHGVDPRSYQLESPPASSDRYILTVGELQPRKNYLMLLRAFRQLCSRVKDHVGLVIVGNPGWMWDSLKKEVADPGLSKRVRLTGYVSNRELAGLYTGASFVVLPSLYEGFGLPAIEAMVSGKPVIASSVSSLPEIVGDAGILLDPRDEDAWADTMEELLTDDRRKASMTKAGLERARQFSWERTVEDTISVYRKVVSFSGAGSR